MKKYFCRPNTLLIFFLLIFIFGCNKTENLTLNESICVESINEKCSQMIKKGAKLPTSFSSEYTNSEDNQDELSLSIYQGESKKIDSNRLVGVFRFPLTQPNKSGEEKVQITIVIDASKQFTLIIEDLKTGKQKEIFGGIVN